MHPTLSLLGLEVLSYHLFLALTVCACFVLGPWLARRLEGIPPRRTLAVYVWIGIAVFAGARLHFVWNAWGFAGYSANPLLVLHFWEGIHAGGAIAALVLATPLVLRVYRVPLASFADAMAPTVGFGVAIARVGCFLNGCCFGAACTAPWCLAFPAGSPPHALHSAAGWVGAHDPWSVAVHPLQLYFAAGGLAAVTASALLYPRRRYAGQVALVALVVLLSATTLAELFRADSYPASYSWAGRPQFFWIALVLAALASAALAAAEWRNRHARSRAAFPLVSPSR